MCKFVQHTEKTLNPLTISTLTLSNTTPHNTLLQENKKIQTLAQSVFDLRQGTSWT